MRIIKNDADVAEGADWLAQNIPEFGQIMPQITPLPLRLRDDGFGPLLSAIMSQQLSVAAAASISAKLDAAGLLEQSNVAKASEEELRACGLSRQKIRYASALAGAGIDFDALRDHDSETVISTLIAVPGIGRWTAEIYAMFSLGHADVFAPNDLALQVAAQHAFDMPGRPTEKQLRALSEDWSPWRSVAARALFAYYRVVKGREGL